MAAGAGGEGLDRVGRGDRQGALAGAPASPGTPVDYWVDSCQRTVLFWDVLRKRGNQAIEHYKAGKPPVLVFDYEMVVDGRQLERAGQLRAGADQARGGRDASTRRSGRS